MDLVQNRQCAFKDVLGLETCFGLLSQSELFPLRHGEQLCYGSFAYSSIALLRVGISGSASFQSARKSL
jgi:hypothetical protein